MTGGILGTCATPFGWGTLAKVTFNATYITTLPTIATCVLDLCDTNLTDSYGQPLGLPHIVYNGLYQAPYTRITGDINGDGIVDIFDVVIVAAAFGTTPSDPNWDPRADLKPEFGLIDIFDFVVVATHFGEKA